MKYFIYKKISLSLTTVISIKITSLSIHDSTTKFNIETSTTWNVSITKDNIMI